MLAIMIAIAGLISIIWTAVVLYNSDLDSSSTTATLLLVFGFLGVGKHVKIQCQIQNKYEELKAISAKMTKYCMYPGIYSSERLLLPENKDGVGIINIHNLHNSQVKSFST